MEKGLTVLQWLSERLGSSSKYTTKLEVFGGGESDLKGWQFRNHWNIYIYLIWNDRGNTFKPC